MKKYYDVVDQIGPLYQASLINISLMHRFKNNCWYLICSKVVISVTEGDIMKEEDLWLLCRTRYMETKDNIHLPSNVSFIFYAFREEVGLPEDVLNNLRSRETKLNIQPSWTR